MNRPVIIVLLVLLLPILSVYCRNLDDFLISLPSEISLLSDSADLIRSGGSSSDGDDSVGTRWAVLIAGSSGYGNYRHQVLLLSSVWFDVGL